jgi:hypothetical protein
LKAKFKAQEKLAEEYRIKGAPSMPADPILVVKLPRLDVRMKSCMQMSMRNSLTTNPIFYSQ